MIVDESLVVREMEEILDRVRSAGLRLPASVVFAGGAFSCLGRYVASATASGPILVVGGRFVRDRQCRLSLEEQFAGTTSPRFTTWRFGANRRVSQSKRRSR